MIDVNIILNVLIALLLYNIVIKAIGATVLKEIMKTSKGKEAAKDVRKSFKERLAEKETIELKNDMDIMYSMREKNKVVCKCGFIHYVDKNAWGSIGCSCGEITEFKS